MKLLFTLALAFGLCAPGLAQTHPAPAIHSATDTAASHGAAPRPDHEPSTHPATSHPPDAGHYEGFIYHPGANQYHHDNFEFFVGETFLLSGHHAAPLFTVGLDYEHRFNAWHHRLGLGLLVDYEMTQANVPGEWLFTPTLEFFPLHHLKLFAGGGYALRGDLGGFMWRAGGGYEIFLSPSLFLTPTVSYDVTPFHRTLVSGLAVGFGR